MPNFCLQFSLHFGENFLVGLRRKHLDPTIYFPSFPPNQTHSKKVFLPIFSSKFSIHYISPLNKHTLKHSSLANIQLSFDIYIFVHLCFHMIGYTQTHFSASLLSVSTCLDEIMILYSYSHIIDHMLKYLLHVLIFICSHACLLLT